MTEKLYRWVKSNYPFSDTLLSLSTNIANKVQGLPSVKSNHHTTLQKAIEEVLKEWLEELPTAQEKEINIHELTQVIYGNGGCSWFRAEAIANSVLKYISQFRMQEKFNP